VLDLLTEHELAGRDPHEGSAVARLRLFDAVSDLLGEAAGEAPLLLALDDLHWADEATMRLLEHVVRDQRRSRLLVAIGYRDTEPARSDLAGTVADLGRELPVERIRLRPLAGAEIAEIASEAGGGALPPEALRAIDAEAEGNPFFAQELASHLADDGQAEASLPDSVSAVIERRLSRLAPATQDMLTRASALGREFDLGLLEQLAQGAIDDVLPGVEEALAAGLIEEAPDGFDRFSFSHALVRSVLYEGLSAPRRLRLHEQIAALLEERRAARSPAPPAPGSTAEIARHCLAALPRGDVEHAVYFAVEAAREAVALLAYEEAVEHSRRGLTAIDRHMPDPGPHRLTLLVQLCDAERLAGRMVEARSTAGEAIEEARVRGDSDALARAVLAHGGAGFESAFVDETMVALLEEALEAVGPTDGVLRLRLLARLAKALHYAGEESQRAKRSRLGADAMAMAGRLGGPRAELIALEGSHFALCQPGNLDQRLAAARRIIDLATQLSDSEFGLLGRYFLIADLVEAGDLEVADEAIDEYGDRAAAANAALHRWYHARFLGMRALLSGRLDEAERRAHEAFALGSAVEPKTATMHFGTQLWMLERERGGLAGLEEPVRGFVAEYPAVPAWRLGLTWVLLDQGRQEEAGEVFSEFTEARFRNIPEDAIWTLTIALAAELAVRGLAGEAELEELVRLIEPYADRNVVSGEAIISGGPMSLPLAMVELELGRSEDAARHLELAAVAADSMGAEPFRRRAEALLSGVVRA
jgi:hypothetical protein